MRCRSSIATGPEPREERVSAAGRGPEDRWEPLVVVLAFVWFAARAGFYALRIHPSIPPDEVAHLGLALVFSSSWLPPSDSPATYPLGLVTTVPTLYYALMGKLLWLNGFGAPPLVFARLANVGLGLLTVVAAWRAVRLLSPDPRVRTLFLVMVTNLPMFVFLSGSVSYDNLTNLLAATATFQLFAWLGARRPVSLVLLLLWLALGCLTKLSFAPLAAILLAVLVWHERRAPGAALRALAGALRRPTPGLAAAAALLVVAGGLGAQLYGGNLVRYGRLAPRADRVIGLEAALQHRIFARNFIVSGYRRGELTRERAVEMARGISHAGDRANTLALLRRVDAERAAPEPRDPLRYAAGWAVQMLRSSVSISGHAVLNKPALDLAGYALLGGLALMGLAAAWRRREIAPYTGTAALVAIGYLLVLAALVGWPAYRHSGAPGLVAQGRYAFPVLVPAAWLLAHYLLAAFPARARLGVLLVVSAFLVWQDLPWFLARATPVWFQPP
jgi:hypothetical protein